MTPAGREDSEGAPPPDARLWLMLLRPALNRIREGSLHLQLPDGRVLSAGSGAPSARIEIRRWRALRRMAFGGELGLARAFLDGDWDTPDLMGFFQTALANMQHLKASAQGTLPSRLAGLFHHRRRANTRRGSRRNIAAHYDLGNDFYAEWLDPSMTYSSGFFEEGANSLETAQHAKYRRICEAAGIKPGDRVLEIGCGWGGFAEVAAREYGASIEGVTLSTEQLAYARERAERGGFADRARFHLTDYRDTDGHYDHVVSIEMFEAVGEKYWPTYFDTVRNCLKPGARATLQIITIANEVFPTYRKTVDFIQKHIFPGGMLPSPNALREQFDKAGLEFVKSKEFGESYSITLRRWYERFNEAWPKIQQLDRQFDERFKRMWDFYLTSCAAAFHYKNCDVTQVTVRRPG